MIDVKDVKYVRIIDCQTSRSCRSYTSLSASYIFFFEWNQRDYTVPPLSNVREGKLWIQSSRRQGEGWAPQAYFCPRHEFFPPPHTHTPLPNQFTSPIRQWELHRLEYLGNLQKLSVLNVMADRLRKWKRRHEFKYWTRLTAFYFALIVHLLPQLWVNSRAD